MNVPEELSMKGKERRRINMKRLSFTSLGCLLLITCMVVSCTPANKRSNLQGLRPIGDLAQETVAPDTTEKNKEKNQAAPSPPAEKKKVKPAAPKPPGEKKEGQPDAPQEDWQQYEEYETQC
jgi:hypothetical protein